MKLMLDYSMCKGTKIIRNRKKNTAFLGKNTLVLRYF